MSETTSRDGGPGRLQRGAMMLEALIGILIFSSGILALVGMQALSIGYVADAEYRSDASFLANEIIGQMWVDRANLAGYAYPGGSAAALTTWIAKVNSYLPGSDVDEPTIAVNAATGQVTVTVRWRPPNAASAHNHIALAIIENP